MVSREVTMKTCSATFRSIGTACIGLVFSLSAQAAPSPPDGQVFVKTFEEVCIPQRLSYEGTLSVASDLEWAPLDAAKYPEFAQFASFSREMLEEMVAEDPELFGSTRTAWMTREIQDRTYLLGVNLLETETLDSLGCYLYDFDASATIDPALVTQMLQQPVAYSTDKNAEGFEPMREVDPAIMIRTVWGPPLHLPRTLDTQLMFVPEASPAAKNDIGFVGLVLSFSTSLPSWEARQKSGS